MSFSRIMLTIVATLALSACASTSSLPTSADQIANDTRTGKTDWAQRQDFLVVRGINRQMAFEAARAGLKAGSFQETSASYETGAVIGERGMTLNDWNVVAGLYFREFQNGYMFHARSQGSYDIGYGGETTGDDWPRRMLSGVRSYILTNSSAEQAQKIIFQ